MATYSDMIKSLRHSANLTQEELAKKIGVSKSAISMYEKGVRKPSFEVEEAMADIFNVSIDILRGYNTEIRNEEIAALISFVNTRSEVRELLKTIMAFSSQEINNLVMIAKAISGGNIVNSEVNKK